LLTFRTNCSDGFFTV